MIELNSHSISFLTAIQNKFPCIKPECQMTFILIEKDFFWRVQGQTYRINRFQAW